METVIELKKRQGLQKLYFLPPSSTGSSISNTNGSHSRLIVFPDFEFEHVFPWAIMITLHHTKLASIILLISANTHYRSASMMTSMIIPSSIDVVMIIMRLNKTKHDMNNNCFMAVEVNIWLPAGGLFCPPSCDLKAQKVKSWTHPCPPAFMPGTILYLQTGWEWPTE